MYRVCSRGYLSGIEDHLGIRLRRSSYSRLITESAKRDFKMGELELALLYLYIRRKTHREMDTLLIELDELCRELGESSSVKLKKDILKRRLVNET